MKTLISDLQAGQKFILKRTKQSCQVIFKGTHHKVFVKMLGESKRKWLNGQCVAILEDNVL